MNTKQMVDFEKLAQDLRTSTKRIRFTKRDGTVRDLRGTLQESVLPARTEETTRAPNPAVMSVWDVDNNGWRSFRRDSVIEILD
jgi:hypothetical protein